MIDYYTKDSASPNFPESLGHRIGTRTWMALHSIIDRLSDSDQEYMITHILKCFGQENTPSLRFYLEWAAMRLIFIRPTLIHLVLTKIQEYDAKPNSVLSCIIVLAHVVKRLPESDQLKCHYAVLPWSMSTAFLVRVYAQYYIYTNCKSLNQEPFIGSVKLLENSKDLKKQQKKSADYYIASGLDVEKDVNLVFIFNKSFSVLNSLLSERISMGTLKSKLWQNSDLPLTSDKSRMEVYEKYAGLMAIPGKDLGHLHVMDTQKIEEKYYQRKVVPDQERQLVRFPLIVVASLLEKIPNLGGLSR